MVVLADASYRSVLRRFSEWPTIAVPPKAMDFGPDDPHFRVRKYLAASRKQMNAAVDDSMRSFAGMLCGLEKTMVRTKGTKRASKLREQLHLVMKKNASQLLALKDASLEQSEELTTKANQLVQVRPAFSANRQPCLR